MTLTNNLLPVNFTKKALKQLKSFRKSDKTLYMIVDQAITDIRQDPSIGEAKWGNLDGYFCYDVYHQINSRKQINYEICYQVETDENGDVIAVIFMGPRENFYDDLKRYLGL